MHRAMSPRRRVVVAIALACVAFVIAGTGHGRQLRREREAHGYLQMDPEQGWPQPLHEIWRQDQAGLKVGSAVAAVVVAGGAVAAGGGVGMGVLGLLLWGPALGFFVAALMSVARLRAFDAAAATSALPATLGLLVLALACLGVSAYVGVVIRRRASKATT